MIKLIIYNKKDIQLCKYMHDMVQRHYPVTKQVLIALNKDNVKTNKIIYVSI